MDDTHVRHDGDGQWRLLALPLAPGMSTSATHGPLTLAEQSIVPPDSDAFGQISRVEFATHLGTHVDAPLHFIRGGATIDQYPLDRFLLRAIVVDVRGRDGGDVVTVADLQRVERHVHPGDAVLFCFGWGAAFGTDRYRDHPSLDLGAAGWLVEHGVSLVGSDTLSVDLAGPRRPRTFDYPVHRLLLGADVLVMEGVSEALEENVDTVGRLLTPPVRFVGADGAPVVPLYRPDASFTDAPTH